MQEESFYQSSQEDFQLNFSSMLISSIPISEIHEEDRQQIQQQQELSNPTLIGNEMSIECPICFHQYDPEQHKPMLICPLGQHICCHQCFKQIFTGKLSINCPFCRKKIIKQSVSHFRHYTFFLQKTNSINAKLNEKMLQIKIYQQEIQKLQEQKVYQQKRMKKHFEDMHKLQNCHNQYYQSSQIKLFNQKTEIEKNKQTILQLKTTLEQSKDRFFQKQTKWLKKTYDLQKNVDQLQKQSTLLKDQLLSNKNSLIEEKKITDVLNKQVAKLKQSLASQTQQCLTLSKNFQNFKQNIKNKYLLYSDQIGQVLNLKQQEILQQRGQLYMKQGKFNIATELFQHFIQANPTQQFEIYGLGNIEDICGFYQNKQQKRYFDLIDKKTIKSNPFDALSICYLKLKQFSKAKQWYQSMLSKTKGNNCFTFALANTYYNLGDVRKAEQLYKDITGDKTYMNKVYQLRAYLHYYNYLTPQSVEFIKKLCLKSLSHEKTNIYSKFLLHQLEEQPKTKQKQLITLFQLEPNFIRCKSALSCHYIQAKQYKLAFSLSEQCIKQNQGYDRPYLNIGYIYELQDKRNQAISIYQQCLEYCPQSFYANFCLAKLYSKEKHFQKIKQYYLKSIKQNPYFLKALSGLASAYLNFGDINNALIYYQKCLQIEPESQKYSEVIGNIYFYNKKDIKKAQNYYQKCINLNPQNFRVTSQIISIRGNKSKILS